MTRFLLIEDEVGSAKGFALRLKRVAAHDARWDIGIEIARTIDEALVAEDHECVLLDLKLANGDITDTVRRIPELAKRGRPVIIVTNTLDMDVADDCIAKGAEDFIRKTDCAACAEVTIQRLYFAIQRRKRKAS